VQHLHIHLPDTRDANNRAAGEKLALAQPRLRDQERPNGPNGPNGVPPQILARLLQDGATGDWRAVDAEGNELEVRHGEDGALEICHRPNGEPNGDEADPDEVGRHPGSGYPGAGGPNAEAAVGAAHDAAAYRAVQRFGAALSPAQQYGALRHYKQMISDYYKPKAKAQR
jgi:hypothetical protein